jgi:hypothetical protein
MRENSGFIIACGLIWVSVLILVFVGESDAGFVLTLLLLPAALIGWVVLLVIAVVRLLLRTQLPLPKRAIPLWFAIGPTLVYASVRTGLNKIREENTWLTIKQYDFSGSDNFQFMKDGTYTQWRDSPLGSSAEKSGSYERKDSILTLHPKPKDGKMQELKLAIRPYSGLSGQPSGSHATLITLDTTVRAY